MDKKSTPAADPGSILAKATTRACNSLGLSGATLARVIGISETNVSLLLRGEFPLEPHSKHGELSLLLVRVHRSLDPLVGTDDQKRKLWMKSHNNELGGIPSQLIENAQGLVATLNYLEGLKALG